MTFELNKKHHELDGLRELTTEELEMVSGGLATGLRYLAIFAMSALTLGIIVALTALLGGGSSRRERANRRGSSGNRGGASAPVVAGGRYS